MICLQRLSKGVRRQQNHILMTCRIRLVMFSIFIISEAHEKTRANNESNICHILLCHRAPLSAKKYYKLKKYCGDRCHTVA